MVSSNSDLQQSIDNDITRFFSFLKELKTNNGSSYNELMDVGMTYQEEVNTVYIIMDFIKGEIDNVNIKEHNCILKDEILSNELDILFNDKNKRYIVSVPPPVIKKTGGKKRKCIHKKTVKNIYNCKKLN
jgi:hypothetical protein